MAVHYHYGAFPPHSQVNWAELIRPLEVASSAISRYDGLLASIPNVDLLLSPLTTQEAVLSSKIEGTQATMGEVLQFEAERGAPRQFSEKKDDISEILNYRKAIRFAMNELKSLPLCQRIVKGSHKILMDSVRGANKAPGQYRVNQNWIGPEGCAIEEAAFIPISADKLPEGMSNWEKYIHADAPSRLVQLALLHAEFEALHPFLDGNGRLGRMLIPLFLWSVNIIQTPTFYISAYFEAHKEQYYAHLRNLSEKGDWTAWCRFFLDAIATQAERNSQKANAILALYADLKKRLSETLRSQYAMSVLDFIFDRPIFSGSHFTHNRDIPLATARRLLCTLREYGVIAEMTPARGRQPAIYCFAQVLNIAEGHDAF